MRRPPFTLSLGLLGLLLSLLTGCTVLGGGGRVVYVDSNTYWTGRVIDAVTAPHPYCRDCGEPRWPTYYPPGPARYDAPALPASPRDRVSNEPGAVRFDPTQARAALAGTDLSSCREQGTPRGYGHALITFGENGFPTKVVIDDPAGMSPTAVKCVGEKLGAQTVASFAGPAPDVGVTFFIE